MLTIEEEQNVKNLVQKAGDYARQRQQQVQADANLVEKKADGSLLTAVDTEVSELLEKGLKEISHYEVLSEEGKNQQALLSAAQQAGKPLWVVDPIDGTKSYCKGEDEYAVNVALLMPDTKGEMQPKWGFVYYPNKGQMLYTKRIDGKLEAVQWDVRAGTETSVKSKLSHQLMQNESLKVATGFHDQDADKAQPFDGIPFDESRHTGPYRAGTVMMGETHAAMMAAPTCIWDTAGIQAVAQAAGLRFMPYDVETGAFSEQPVYYGGDKHKAHQGEALLNPPYICASTQLLRQLGMSLPAHTNDVSDAIISGLREGQIANPEDLGRVAQAARASSGWCEMVQSLGEEPNYKGLGA